MKRNASIVFLLAWIFAVNAGAQEHMFYLKKLNEFTVPKNATQWNVDVFGNIFFVSGDEIVKCDSVGKQKFVQSIKSIGQVDAIVLINTMKIALFSEEQQVVCFFDNTLTPGDDCVDLNEIELSNVTLVSASVQPDKFWFYDALNSVIRKYGLKAGNNFVQGQELINFKGLLGASELIWMKEMDNYLFLYCKDGTLYQVDQFGSLIHQFEGIPIRFDISSDLLFTEVDKVVRITDLSMNQTSIVNCELPQFDSFRIVGKILYVKAVDKIFKYQLIKGN
jgi:hypothetical protein